MEILDLMNLVKDGVYQTAIKVVYIFWLYVDKHPITLRLQRT